MSRGRNRWTVASTAAGLFGLTLLVGAVGTALAAPASLRELPVELQVLTGDGITDAPAFTPFTSRARPIGKPVAPVEARDPWTGADLPVDAHFAGPLAKREIDAVDPWTGEPFDVDPSFRRERPVDVDAPDAIEGALAFHSRSSPRGH